MRCSRRRSGAKNLLVCNADCIRSDEKPISLEGAESEEIAIDADVIECGEVLRISRHAIVWGNRWTG